MIDAVDALKSTPQPEKAFPKPPDGILRDPNKPFTDMPFALDPNKDGKKLVWALQLNLSPTGVKYYRDLCAYYADDIAGDPQANKPPKKGVSTFNNGVLVVFNQAEDTAFAISPSENAKKFRRDQQYDVDQDFKTLQDQYVASGGNMPVDPYAVKAKMEVIK